MSTIPFRRNPRVAKPHVPMAAPTPGSWIVETSAGGGGGGGGSAPDVVIDPPAEVIFRSDHRVEVEILWAANALATPRNFLGAAVYLEDPDISSGENGPMDGQSVPLDGTAQMSGKWSPVFVNDSAESPATVFLDTTMGSTPGQTYKSGRDVRIYLAAYGSNTHARLVRATEPNPTPNILVHIPLGPDSGESGMEYAFLVTGVSVTVTTDYNRPDPNYYLTFFYIQPDPATPVPPGMNHFGGCRIVFIQEDESGNPVFPGTDTGINVPVDQSQTGYKSSIYTPGAGGGAFRCYFCSEDDSQPLGHHINSLVDGVTPYAKAIVPPVPSTPDVTSFTIADQKVRWLLDNSFIAEASFSWVLPDADAGGIRYAGVFLYLVNVTGGTPPGTPFPKALTAQQSNIDTDYILDISDIPAHTETWTIAAISADVNGVLADDPAKFGQPSFHSPTVTWDVGPPTPGSPGSGQEYAPLVTITASTVTPTPTLSADGVGMISFNVGTWANPADNQFGNAQLAMVVNHDATKPITWMLPKNATSFQTPAMPSFGTIGVPVSVDFYVVSIDPQGKKNMLVPGTTPVIHYTFMPSQGAVIPARSGWFDPKQFSWSGSTFQADNFSAKVIQVGKTLIVGGAPSSFGGNDNGQIAVLDSHGKLLDWLGQQQPEQGNSQPLWGAWLGQVWIGGTNPLDAPIFVDNQGIIEVGGIAAAQGSQYPYISVRDSRGYEMGRIGAALNVPSGGPGDGVGPNPPQLAAGAWFTQLGIGGSNISNWNVLVIPDASNPLGSQFLMRNINKLEIDYPAVNGSPANAEYQMQFGNSVWMAAGLSGSWRFPGIHIYEVDNQGNNFGATFVNRGVVLRGTQPQGYHVLASMVTYNGDSSGSDFPQQFWAELAMYSPLSPFNRTVYLASGSAANGGGYFILSGTNGNEIFQVDQSGHAYISGILQGARLSSGASTPVTAVGYNVFGFGPVIDAAGNWKGRAIPTSGGIPQTPWTSNIDAAGFWLTGAGNISAVQYLLSGNVVINNNGAFLGAGVSIQRFGVSCGYLSTLGSGNGTGDGSMDVGLIRATGASISGQVYASGGFAGGVFSGSGVATNGNVSAGSYGGGAFTGAGVNVSGQGISCGYLSTKNSGGNGLVDTVDVSASRDIYAGGGVHANGIWLGNVQVAGSNGIWLAGLQCNDFVLASKFGISGAAFGVTENFTFTFATPGGGQQTVTLKFNGGLYVGH